MDSTPRQQANRSQANRRVACVQLDTKPANEAQARPLSALPKEERATAWETVIERAPKDESGQPKVTAKLVQAVVDDWASFLLRHW
jgi:hypothetical protein